MNDRQQKVSRRRMVAGAGTAGALAAVAAILPVGRDQAAQPATAKLNSHEGGGYSVSEHELRYYQTTRV